MDYSISGTVFERKTWYTPHTANPINGLLVACVAAHDRIVMAKNCGGLEMSDLQIILFADLPSDLSFHTWKIDRLCVLNHAINRFRVTTGFTYQVNRVKTKRNHRRIRIFKRENNGITNLA